IKELNETIRYTLWSVFRASEPFHSIRQDLVSDTESFFEKHCSDGGVTVRGTYDLSGMRADADVMVWWHAESSDQLQKAYSELRRTAFGRHLTPVWSNMAVHRPAEFNRSHIPAFLADEEPRDYLCVYPFVRSYEWYLLPDEERRDMLREHGMQARDYPDVYIVGDSAYAVPQDRGQAAAPTAQNAVHQAEVAARNLLAEAAAAEGKGAPPRLVPYTARDRGVLVSVGVGEAVGELSVGEFWRPRLSGFSAYAFKWAAEQRYKLGL
ncbi:MAG: hydrogen peroxide-dependent heme synthase, partial [Limnochordales bacterium]